MTQVQINNLVEQYRRTVEEVAVLGNMIEKLTGEQVSEKSEMTRDEAWAILMSELEKGSKSGNAGTWAECMAKYGL